MEIANSINSFEYTVTGDPAEVIAFSSMGLILLLAFMLPIFIAMYAIFSYFLSRIFKKAGTPAWIAWVPVYSNWKMLELGGQHGAWSIVALIPFVGIAGTVFLYIAAHNISLKLGYDVLMTVVAILLMPVWYIIMAFSPNQWNDSLGAPRLDTPATPQPQPTPHY